MVPLITFIAFLCIFGTVITVIDGFLVSIESLRLLIHRGFSQIFELWMTITAIIGIVIIQILCWSSFTMLRLCHDRFFPNNTILRSLERYVLVTRENKNLPSWLKLLAIAGLIFLFGFAIFFIYALAIGKAG